MPFNLGLIDVFNKPTYVSRSQMNGGVPGEKSELLLKMVLPSRFCRKLTQIEQKYSFFVFLVRP